MPKLSLYATLSLRPYSPFIASLILLAFTTLSLSYKRSTMTPLSYKYLTISTPLSKRLIKSFYFTTSLYFTSFILATSSINAFKVKLSYSSLVNKALSIILTLYKKGYL
jgi:hypothetical protein